MTSSTARPRRGSENEPPAANGGVARTSGNTAVADPSTSPDRFLEITQALGTLGVSTAAEGPLPPLPSDLSVAAAGWKYNQAITHLFSYDSPDGAWVFVNSVGWKRLSPASAFGVNAMIIIATLATHDNLPANYHEDAAGLIDQIYV
jgi:hypothetical protein